MYTVKTRLYQTIDGKVVPEGHEDARLLYATPGRKVSDEEAERKGLAKIDIPSKKADAINDGTVDEVLDRVGDSADLAQAALDAEQSASKPRKTLVDALQEILEPDADASQTEASAGQD